MVKLPNHSVRPGWSYGELTRGAGAGSSADDHVVVRGADPWHWCRIISRPGWSYGELSRGTGAELAADRGSYGQLAAMGLLALGFIMDLLALSYARTPEGGGLI